MLLLDVNLDDAQRSKILDDTRALVQAHGTDRERQRVRPSLDGLRDRSRSRTWTTPCCQFQGPPALLEQLVAHAAHHRRRRALPGHQDPARRAAGAGSAPVRRARHRRPPRRSPSPPQAERPFRRRVRGVRPSLRGATAQIAWKRALEPRIPAGLGSRLAATTADRDATSFAPERSTAHGRLEHQPGHHHREPHRRPRAPLAAERNLRLQAARRRATRAARTAPPASGSTSPTTST